MSSYYKHARKESAEVPYSFRCEHCMQDSGLLRAVITGPAAEKNSNYNVLTQPEIEKLEKKAHENLIRQVRQIHDNATQKHIYSADFKDTCPHCKKPQSWAVSGMQKNMYSTPIISIVVGIIVSGLCYVYTIVEQVDFGFPVIPIIMGIAVVCALGSLMINMAKISAKKKATSAVTQKNLPTIDWEAVRHLLT